MDQDSPKIDYWSLLKTIADDRKVEVKKVSHYNSTDDDL